MCKVSIIINCLNGEEFLQETLDSVRKQTYSNYEIVFWDNCSDDRTGEIAKAYGEKLKYFRGEKTVPLGEARNLALEKARGEYIAFLDSDDLWEPDKLEVQVRALDSDSTIGLVCSNYNMVNMMTGRIKIFDRHPAREEMSFSSFIDHYSYCFSTFMIRKKAIDELTYWFADNLRYAEEFELFVRIAYKWKALYLPNILATYRIHSTMNSMHLIEVQYDEYNFVLQSLRQMDSDIDMKYPDVINWISFVRDLSGTKSIIRKGANKRVKELMKPYLKYNIRAKCFYLVALLPEPITKIIANCFYSKRF